MKTILIVLSAAISGCSLTVSPDGSRTWTMNGAEAARAIQIISQK